MAVPDVDRSAAAPPARIGWHQNDLLPTLLLTGLLLLTFANTLHDTGFPFDNESILVDTRLHAVTLENLRLILAKDYWWSEDVISGLYRPVTTLSYLFNYAVLSNGQQATGYHLVNLLLHLSNVLLVYFLLLGIVRERGPAFFTAAIFGVHPINVEAVTNIVGRADLLAALAVLAAVHCHMRAAAAAGPKKYSWLVGLAVSSTIGVFCKETGVLALPLILLYDFAFRLQPAGPINIARQLRRFFFQSYWLLLPSLLFFALVHKLIFGDLEKSGIGFLDNPLAATDFLTARLTAVKVIGKYLSILCWPGQLSSDYSYLQIPLVQWPFSGWEDWQTFVAGGLVLFALWAAVQSYRRSRILFFLILFFLVAYLPTGNLLPRPGEPIFAKESWIIGSMMAERFMYLPSIGFAGTLVLAVFTLGNLSGSACSGMRGKFPRLPQKTTVIVLLVPLVGALALRSHLRNFDWENELTLTSKDVLASPNSHRLHGMAAWALFLSDPGRTQIDRVIAHGERAIAIAGDSHEPLFKRLGLYYLTKGDVIGSQQADTGLSVITPERRQWYEKGIATLQKAAEVGNRQAIKGMRKRGETVQEGPNALAAGGDPETYYLLGLALKELGRKTEAFKAFLNMRQLAVYDHRSYVLMAGLYEEANDPAMAAKSLLQAVLLDNREQATIDSLARMYQKIPGGECAIDVKQGRNTMNFSCPPVQQHICEASVLLVELFLGIREFDRAWEMVQGSTRVFGCDQNIYDHLMPK